MYASYVPDFVVELLSNLDLECRHLVEHLRLVEADQVVYDDVRGPEVVHHVPADVDLSLGPVCGLVEDHAGLGPKELVGEAEADLLHGKDKEEEIGTDVLFFYHFGKGAFLEKKERRRDKTPLGDVLLRSCTPLQCVLELSCGFNWNL